MFGLIVSGRLVQTDFQQVGATQFLTTVLEADNINHIVVFLTGVQPFPEGLGGSVYFSWPDPSAPPTWQLLGFISNNKPSAIFKITKLKPEPGRAGITPVFGLGQISHNAQIGISIEPLEQIAMQAPSIVTEPSKANTFMEFAQKTIQNLFDYVASFCVAQSQMMPNPNETYIPMSALRNWYNNFERRLQQNPNFWKS
nr:EOG090X0D82 [Cyclestheria hislopi]